MSKRILSLLFIVLFIATSFCGNASAQFTDSETLNSGIGGALIGALAGSVGGKAGAGALIGGGTGLALGALKESEKSKQQQQQQQQMQDAYERGLRDGERANYSGEVDRKRINRFGDKLED